jgi:BlaI family transcriptional regulator, penicillinase repressor
MAYRPSLDERDLEVLQLLWKGGPLKPGDLQKRLSFQMKNPALRWLLNDLVARGQLHRKKEGKAFLYSAAVERRPMLAALGQKLRAILFGGSALAMIGELIEIQKLSPEDIDYLKKIARGQGKPKKRKSGRK